MKNVAKIRLDIKTQFLDFLTAKIL